MQREECIMIKKIFTIILALVLASSLFACGNNENYSSIGNDDSADVDKNDELSIDTDSSTTTFVSGSNERNEPITPIKYIVPSRTHTVAITTGGTLLAWGENSSGQLGDGTTEDRNSPVIIMNNVTSAATSGRSTFAITNNGELWGWGYNFSGQLGDGTTENRHNPVKIMDNVANVFSYHYRTFAITNNGELWGWGGGRLGDGTIERRHSPVKIMNDVISLSGLGNQAITSDGTLWGWNTGTEMELSPVKIMDNVASSVMLGGLVFAVTNNGELWGWGWVDGCYGTLGDGTLDMKYSPVKIMDNVASVVTNGRGGHSHPSLYGSRTFAITNNGELWGWGDDRSGVIGNGSNEISPIPSQIMDNVASVVIGETITFAITNNGELWGWGWNIYNFLGTNVPGDIQSPTRIMNNVASFVTYDTRAYAILTNGELIGWGNGLQRLLAPEVIVSNEGFTGWGIEIET